MPEEALSLSAPPVLGPEPGAPPEGEDDELPPPPRREDDFCASCCSMLEPVACMKMCSRRSIICSSGSYVAKGCFIKIVCMNLLRVAYPVHLSCFFKICTTRKEKKGVRRNASTTCCRRICCQGTTNRLTWRMWSNLESNLGNTAEVHHGKVLEQQQFLIQRHAALHERRLGFRGLGIRLSSAPRKKGQQRTRDRYYVPSMPMIIVQQSRPSINSSVP